MTHQLREVRFPADWKALHRIRRDVLFASESDFVAYDENHPDDRTEGNKPFLLNFEGQTIGVARLDRLGNVAVVRLVAIKGEKQRHGHGRKLLQLLEGEAARTEIKILRVYAAMNAVGFYERMGWKKKSWPRSEFEAPAGAAVQMEKRM
jgi:GNAT superfamily N-acetyltransferase